MKKIGVLGGSFDPPHIGHYLMLKQILEIRSDLDQILLIPAYKHQWKESSASVDDRIAMLKNLEDQKVSISDIELRRKGISYTFDTVTELKEQTGAEIFWIVGSDIVAEFDRWEKTEELLTLATFLVFPRDPYHLPEHLPQGFEVIQDTNIITTNISSTTIRERIKEGKSISYLVQHEVEEYIKHHHLYE